MNRPSLTVPAGIPPHRTKIATTDGIRLLIPIKDLREVYRSPRGKPRHYSKGSSRNSGPPTPSQDRTDSSTVHRSPNRAIRTREAMNGHLSHVTQLSFRRDQ